MALLSWIQRKIRVAYVYRSIPRFPIFLIFLLFATLGVVEGTFSFIVLQFFNISELTRSSETIGATVLLFSIQFFLSGPTSWLGQKYGRWKTVFVGWNIMFFSVCCLCMAGASESLITVSTNSSEFESDYYKQEGRLLFSIGISLPLYVGLSCIWANLLLLGVDILNETPPSGEQVSSYFHWTFWFESFGYSLSLAVTYLLSKYDTIVVLTGVAGLSWVTLLVLLYPGLSRATTPDDGKTVSQVWGVIRYVARNGYRKWKSRNQPLLEASETLCNEWRKPDSLFDYAKEEYRGPYTSEYVDDVRKFIHIVIVLFALLGFFTVFILMSTTYLYQTESTGYPKRFITAPESQETYFNHTAKQNISIHYYNTPPAPLTSLASYGTILVGVAILDLIVYPCLGAYSPSIIVRIGIGLAFAAASAVYAMVAEILRYSLIRPPIILTANTFPEIPLKNYNDRYCNVFKPLYDGPKSSYCGYEDSKFPVLNLIPQFVFLGLSQCFINIGAFEHVCGESPIHMRGLLTGLLFTCRGLGYWVAAGLVFSQADYNHPNTWCYFCGDIESNHVPNCIMTYFALVFIIILCGGLYLWVYASQHLKYSQDGDELYVRNLRRAFVHMSNV